MRVPLAGHLLPPWQRAKGQPKGRRLRSFRLLLLLVLLLLVGQPLDGRCRRGTHGWRDAAMSP